MPSLSPGDEILHRLVGCQYAEAIDILNKALCPACRNRLLGLLEHERQQLKGQLAYKQGEIAGLDYAVETLLPPAGRGDA